MSLSRNALIAADAALVVVCALLVGWRLMFGMPGESYRGELPPATDRQAELAERLRGHVETLAGEYPGRHPGNPDYEEAREFIVSELEGMGYEPELETFEARGFECANVVVEVGGEGSDEVVVVGAHYDAVRNTPGADDNASGVAGLIEVARAFADASPERTLRFVFFANEESPYFRTDGMGSLQYARRAREAGESIVAMLSLEMLGYYTDEAGSQEYPPLLSWFYPDRGNFIGFVGNFSSREVVKRSIGTFRRAVDFPSYGFAGPGFVPGVGLSDHSAFWMVDYPALMVTDTAFYRNPHYHRPSDRPETLDYGRFGRVVDGVIEVVEEWGGEGEG
jgi:hypothetical protein